MRKIIYLSISLFINFAYSQGNLQFNRVITFTPGTNYTVPNGKVLKIESVNFASTKICIPKSSSNIDFCRSGNLSQQYTYGIYDAVTILSIGNIIFTSGSFQGTVNYSYSTSCGTEFNGDCWTYDFGSKTFNCPIWLEAGKTVTIHSGVASVLISAIEFNIIP